MPSPKTKMCKHALDRYKHTYLDVTSWRIHRLDSNYNYRQLPYGDIFSIHNQQQCSQYDTSLFCCEIFLSKTSTGSSTFSFLTLSLHSETQGMWRLEYMTACGFKFLLNKIVSIHSFTASLMWSIHLLLYNMTFRHSRKPELFFRTFKFC